VSEERLPPGAVVKPDEASRQALADAIGAMAVHDLLAGMSGEARQVCQARDRIAEAVRNRLLAPLVDEWGNVVGHRFGETSER
jgi:hypothetical protein